jgi:NADH-quinone oxidoreductase subunit H
MNLCWKWFVPLSFGAFLFTAIWMVLPLSATLQMVISLITFGAWGYLMLHFVRRVRYNVHESRVPLHLNPFI